MVPKKKRSKNGPKTSPNNSPIVQVSNGPVHILSYAGEHKLAPLKYYYITIFIIIIIVNIIACYQIVYLLNRFYSFFDFISRTVLAIFYKYLAARLSCFVIYRCHLIWPFFCRAPCVRCAPGA